MGFPICLTWASAKTEVLMTTVQSVRNVWATWTLIGTIEGYYHSDSWDLNKI